MRLSETLCATMLAVVFASNAAASLTGVSYNAASSSTGSVTVADSGPGPFIAPAGPSICVGPGDGCASSGLYGSVGMNANQIGFNFNGSTGFSTGTFVLTLSNFSVPITSVTYNSGSLLLGTFAVTSFTATSVTFTGTSIAGFNAGLGATILFDVVVPGPAPYISKSFGAPTIPLGGTTSLNFNIKNLNDDIGLTGVAFSDSLPAGLVVATPNGLSGSCGGGTITAAAGSSTVSLSGAALSSGASCTFSVNVTGLTAGVKTNSVLVTSSNYGDGNTSTASLEVIGAPTFSKAFSPSAINLGGVSTLSFTIGNDFPVALTGLAFTDTFPSGVTLANPNGLSNTCGGTVSTTANSIALTGGTVNAPAGTTCVIKVNVLGLTDGPKVNTTSALTSTNASAAKPAVATLFVGIPPYLMRYSSNLTQGDSLINITNTGENGNNLFGPGYGDPAGNICVNIYAFSPDEQLISCCSCLVTPNGLVHLTANNDLVSNTLTGIRPDSIVIKMVATGTGPGPTFGGSSCTNSAALAGSAAFPVSNGMLAFGTTLHSASSNDPNPVGPFSVTETPFLPATLSLDELASVRNRCTNIIGNGSTFGICKSCRLGGLGADKQ